MAKATAKPPTSKSPQVPYQPDHHLRVYLKEEVVVIGGGRLVV